MKDSSILFIDESGKSSLAEKEDEPFLLTGVILDNKEIQAVEGFFSYIKRKYKIPQEKPFHSYEIFENPKKKLPDTQLLLLSPTLAEFISLIPIRIYIVIINKLQFKSALGIRSNDDFKGSEKRKEMRSYPYRIMASYLFAKFGEHLQKNKQIGQIFADSRRGADHQLLKTLNLCKEGVVPFRQEYTNMVKENVTALCFAEKGFLSGGLEITDLISYVSFIRVRRMISSATNIGLDKIWEEVKNKASVIELKEGSVRSFFGIKKGEVHKYLK